MTEAQAKAVQTELNELCKDHGLWFEVSEQFKPNLKDIVYTIRIKVTDK